MQMYAGLPVVTNKPSLHEMAGVPHHLLGIIQPNEIPWIVGHFLAQAKAHIDDLHARGRLPILVGGTHYYLQSLLFTSTVTGPASDLATEPDDVSEKWPILDAQTTELYAELSRVDPEIAKRWHPNDRRKIRRSLEIFLKTGRKASEVYSDQRHANAGSGGILDYGKLAYNAILFWAHTERQALIRRLDERVDSMIANGLLDEVSQLSSVKHQMESQGDFVDTSKGVWVSIGYKEFEAYSEAVRSGASREELDAEKHKAIERTKIATRQYAKSQVKWIRSKLLRALNHADEAKSLHLVDTGQSQQWLDSVLRPVEAVMNSYLSGEPVPQILQSSDIAKEMLSSQKGIDLSGRPDLWVSKRCELCGVTAITELEWESHILGRSHRGAVKRQTRRVQSAV